MDPDVPWAALYRQAIACGIGDAAFWTMNTAALFRIAAGMGRRAGRTPAAKKGGGEPIPFRAGGGLADCP